MNTPICRLALKLAFTRTAEHRWRLLALVLTTAVSVISTLAVLSGLSVLAAQETRNHARSPVPASDHATARTVMVDTADTVFGRQYTVIYVEPAHATVTAAVPPGLRGMPEPGQAVLSPRLSRLADAHPEIAARYPHRTAYPIGDAGLRDPRELLAYVRPSSPEGMVDPDRATFVSRFGGAGARSDGFIGTQAEPALLYLGLAGFVGVPVTVLLVVGSRATAPVRDRRIVVLQTIGVAPKVTRCLAAMEAAWIAGAGAVAGTALYSLLRPHFSTVPITGFTVSPSDTELPSSAYILAAVSVVVVVAITGAITTPHLQALGRRPRPDLTQHRLSRWRLAPVVAGLILCAISVLIAGANGAQLFFVGLILSLAGIPLTIGHLVRRCGMLIGRFPYVPPLLAGRRLVSDPGQMARYLAAATVLTFIIVNGQVWISRLDVSAEQFRADTQWAQTMRVSALGLHHGDQRAFSGAGAETVVPYAQSALGDEVLLTDCRSLARLIDQPDTDCETPAPQTARQLKEALQQPADLQRLPDGPSIRGPILGAGHAIDVSRLPPAIRDELEIRGFYVVAGPSQRAAVQSTAFAKLTAPFVFTTETLVMRPSPLIGWIFAGIALTGAYMALALAATLIDAAFQRRRDYGLLTALGIRRSTLTGIVLWETAAPVAIALPVTLCAAALTGLCLVAISGQGAVSVALLGGLLAGGLAFGLAGALTSAALIIPTVRPDIRND